MQKIQTQGVHHITMETPNIYRTKDYLEKMGIPYFGFNDYGDIWKELFIHPKDAFGVLIQIAEFKPDDWLNESMIMPENRKWEILKNGDNYTLKMRHPGGGKAELHLSKDEIQNLISDLESSQ